jgi:hypothetical protein
LTRYAEDAIGFVETAVSRENRMVGTESRLRLVIDTLTDLVQGASSDRERRLLTLIQQRDELDREIDAIRSGAAIETYHPAQVRERFHTAVDMLKTLQGDFRAVEDRFEEIARDVTRGAIEHVRAMVPSLLAEAENVLRQTGRLSQTLRRLLDNQSTGHRQRTAEVLLEIRTLAAKMKQSTNETGEPVPTNIGLQVDTSLGVSSPLTRPFWTPPQVFDVAPETREIDWETAKQQARKLAGLKRLQWDRMRDLVHRVTDLQTTVTLSQLLQHHPIKVGVIELVGWIQIAHEDGHKIDPEAIEQVTVITDDPLTGGSSKVHVRIPLVTFSRTHQSENEPVRKGKPR